MGKIKRINHLKMLNDICDVVETDFCLDMETRTLPGSKEYTQEEAAQMARVISMVYSIAHGIHCSCGNKYRV